MIGPTISIATLPLEMNEPREEVRIDIYPPPTVEVEQTSLFSRFKKFIANTMASMMCGVANRSFVTYTETENPITFKTGYKKEGFSPI